MPCPSQRMARRAAPAQRACQRDIAMASEPLYAAWDDTRALRQHALTCDELESSETLPKMGWLPHALRRRA